MSLTSWFRGFRKQGGTRTSRANRPASRRLSLEQLEDRTLPSAYVVTTAADNGDNNNPIPGSLRDAINQVNLGNDNEIDFNITSGSDYNSITGVATITPLSTLPTIANPVIINGYTQGECTPLAASPNTNTLLGSNVGDNAHLKIVLDGSQAGAVDGLTITGGYSTVSGLVIDNFASGSAIVLKLKGCDVVAGNFIGTDVTGESTYTQGGILIQEASNNVVGGTAPGAGNVIAAADFGVWIDGDNPPNSAPTNNNLVQGNYIGVNPAGVSFTIPVYGGVRIDQYASNNTIGGTTASAGNVIGLGGVFMICINASQTGNTVENNYIGTKAAGSAALVPGEAALAPGEDGQGITVAGFMTNTMISTNLISGLSEGVQLTVFARGSCQLQGNLIGTDFTGTKSIPNGVGIVLFGRDSQIGGTAPGEGNVIANNVGPAVEVFGTGQDIEGNSIYGKFSPAIDNLAQYGDNLGTPFIDTNWPGGPFTGTDNTTFPSLTLTQSGSTLTFNGTMTGGQDCTRYLVYLWTTYPDGNYRGEYYTYVTTDANGDATFTKSFNAPPGFPTTQGLLSPAYAYASPPHYQGNDEQNSPLLTTAQANSTSTSISGSFNSTPNDTFRLGFFSNASPGQPNTNDPADANLYGQGQTYLGTATITTGANGNPVSSDGSAIINADGSFTVSLNTPLPAGQIYLTATATDVTAGAPGFDDTSEFSPTLIVTSLLTSQTLQSVVSAATEPGASGIVIVQAATPTDASAAIAAVTDPAFGAQPAAVTIQVNLASGSYTDILPPQSQVPPNVTLILNGSGGTTLIGQSPALTVSGGNVIVENVTLTTATDAPTILVTGGSVTLRNDVIQESTGFTDAAISVTGGTLDLGTSTDAGGNTINVNGAGTFLHNTTARHVSTVGDTFEINGQVTAWPIALTVTTNSSLMLAGNSLPPLTGSVNGMAFTSPFMYTTPFGDTVTITLSTTANSASSVGEYPITATLSGSSADNYFIVPNYGTMDVVSIGADPSSTTGAQAVTFWDNKGNAKLITSADLSSLDALNLVTQGGSAFDPKSVAQLQAWLSTSPNATAASQLAVQLAAMDLNVLAGYVKASDLLFAGGLLPYATADNITGLTSGGFIDVQYLIQAANAALAQVSPGDPSSDPNQAYELALAQVLQAANGNSDFVQQELFWNLVGLYPSLIAQP